MPSQKKLRHPKKRRPIFYCNDDCFVRSTRVLRTVRKPSPNSKQPLSQHSKIKCPLAAAAAAVSIVTAERNYLLLAGPNTLFHLKYFSKMLRSWAESKRRELDPSIFARKWSAAGWSDALSRTTETNSLIVLNWRSLACRRYKANPSSRRLSLDGGAWKGECFFYSIRQAGPVTIIPLKIIYNDNIIAITNHA